MNGDIFFSANMHESWGTPSTWDARGREGGLNPMIYSLEFSPCPQQFENASLLILDTTFIAPSLSLCLG